MIAPLRPSSGLQPATRMVAGFRLPSFRPPCIDEAHFRHRGAPTPVGHGRGLAARPGCAGPGESIDSARRRLHRFRRVGPPRPSRFRLRLRSSMPGERAAPIICLFPGVNRARLRSSPIRITPRCSHTKQSAKRSSHRTRSVGQRSLPKNVPSCDFQLSGLWPGRLRRLSR